MPDPLTVLVVDDEVALASVVAGYLEKEGFVAVQAFDGPSAVELAESRRPDLIVLDVMLPGFDGVEACRRIRTFTDAYIIMLTARDEEVDKIVGLSVGADDYLVKPFSPRELIARVRAMLRRPRALPVNPEVARVGDLVVDEESRTVTVAGSPVELTRTEFDLLATMASRPRLAFSRRQLIDDVWGSEWYGDEHLVDVHIGHLRRKLGDDAGSARYIRTVRGVGYGMGEG
ncbi:MAG: response regulator transcription factor [Candidatus Nanopelagicales bacterium]